MSKNGLFIALEGIDGCGKSTQVNLLAEALRERGVDILVTREPGCTPVGNAIRSILLDPAFQINPEAEFLLYSAARAQHVQQVIRPALEAGQVVLSDRFSGASFAYQGAGRGLPLEELQEITGWATRGLQPNVTLVVDAPVEVALTRVGERGQLDRLEMAGEEFFVRARRGFLELARVHSWPVVDGVGSVGEVHERVWQTLAPFLHLD